MSGAPVPKVCDVAYAGAQGELLLRVELPVQASIGEALRAAREHYGDAPRGIPVPWESATVGIFGEPCSRESVPRDGDRIELYRPLTLDPRARRRTRVAAERVARRRG